MEATRRHGSAILEQLNALQQSNRRVLEKLRPVGLTELGLREALGALLRLWGESRPEVVVETAISPSLGDTGETADLTILSHHSGIADQCVSPCRRHPHQRER